MVFFLSNGPGDPADVPEIVEEIRKLAGKRPIFGICLGHQLLALAFGAKTYKMKFGHRGGNQPVKNLKMGKVHISAQNHGYAVDPASLEKTPLIVTHLNVNDNTIEAYDIHLFLYFRCSTILKPHRDQMTICIFFDEFLEPHERGVTYAAQRKILRKVMVIGSGAYYHRAGSRI